MLELTYWFLWLADEPTKTLGATGCLLALEGFSSTPTCCSALSFLVFSIVLPRGGVPGIAAFLLALTCGTSIAR